MHAIPDIYISGNIVLLNRESTINTQKQYKKKERALKKLIINMPSTHFVSGFNTINWKKAVHRRMLNELLLHLNTAEESNKKEDRGIIMTYPLIISITLLPRLIGR